MDFIKRFATRIVALFAFLASLATIYQLKVQLDSKNEQINTQSNQATQEAKNYGLEKTRTVNIEKLGTLTVDLINQPIRPPSTGEDTFSPTATAPAQSKVSIEATIQAIEVQNQRIQSTQTAIAQIPITSVPVATKEFNVFEGSVPGVPMTTLRLRLSSDQIVMGTADKYQDVKDKNLPPFAVFVIYGPLDENLSMP